MGETASVRARLGRSGAIDIAGFGEHGRDDVWRLDGGLRAGGKAAAVAREALGGGQIATALVAAARLGARVASLGPVGDDALGAALLDELEAEGVDGRAAVRVAGARSRTALLLVEADGERTVVEDRDPRLATAAAPAAEAIARARALHLDATSLGPAIEAARAARAAGRVVSLDLEGDEAALARAAPLVALGDVVFVGLGAAAGTLDDDTLRRRLAALAAQAAPGALVGATLGARGAIALDDNSRLVVAPPFAPPAMVDTTACGDTFHAALLVALLDGGTLEDALTFACAAAALKCRDVGRRGCPRRAEVEALVRGGNRV
jgi:sugar/nucleoside kinase (ribokinase family)